METLETTLTADLNELVTTYFHDKKYRLFREFCFKFQIKTLSEITPDVLTRFSQQLGVGKTKSARIQAIYDSGFPLDEKKKTDTVAQPVEVTLPTTLTFEQIAEINVGIQEAFAESQFKMIVNFCKANNILLVSDMDLATFRRIRLLSGMGPKKYRYLFERLEMLHDHLSKARFEIEGDMFEQLKTYEVAKLIQLFGLKGSEQYQNLTVADLQGRTAQEIVSIGDSHNMILLNRYLRNPETTIIEALEQLTEYERKILSVCQQSDDGMEQVSEQFGLTVDRIHQVEKRIYSRLWATFENQQLLQLLALLDQQSQVVSEAYLHNSLPEYKNLILNILEKN
ncbi:MAG: hypothetical protein ACRDAO_01310 [Culicoidibacterales bacterium]